MLEYENINIDFDDLLMFQTFGVNMEKRFPLLSQVAKRILCVQGASTASEREFSASGYTVWDIKKYIIAEKSKYV